MSQIEQHGHVARETAAAARRVDSALARLAERLRQLRLERGFRLGDLAALSGLSEAHLSRVEAGQRWPSLPALLTLAAAYGVDPSMLLRGERTPETEVIHAAAASWTGEEVSGSGTMRSDRLSITFDRQSRLSDSRDRTGPTRLSSPEEMIGMALAGCFSMSLAQSLAAAGFPPNQVETKADVSLRSGADESAIASIHLRCTADVAGIAQAQLQELGHIAKRSCVVARALAAVPVTLETELRSNGPHGTSVG